MLRLLPKACLPDVENEWRGLFSSWPSWFQSQCKLPILRRPWQSARPKWWSRRWSAQPWSCLLLTLLHRREVGTCQWWSKTSGFQDDWHGERHARGWYPYQSDEQQRQVDKSQASVEPAGLVWSGSGSSWIVCRKRTQNEMDEKDLFLLFRIKLCFVGGCVFGASPACILDRHTDSLCWRCEILNGVPVLRSFSLELTHIILFQFSNKCICKLVQLLTYWVIDNFFWGLPEVKQLLQQQTSFFEKFDANPRVILELHLICKCTGDTSMLTKNLQDILPGV